MTTTVEVAVVGAGVVGSAIARELVRHDIDVALIDSADDVGTGTSKANTAIWHTGFDAKAGTLEARLVARGHTLLDRRAAESAWPLERIGALLVAWDDEQRDRLAHIVSNANAVGYRRIETLSVAQVYEHEPHLGPGATGGLLVPDEGLLDPWAVTLVNATEAVLNGARLLLRAEVTTVETDRRAGSHAIATARGLVRARWLVNAAGLGSDTVDRLMGHDGFTVTPRRGELIVFDKLARPLLTHIVLPVPTATTKGVLVSPTVYGNVLLGPTADDVDDRSATGTTAVGLASLVTRGRRIVPALVDHEITATYAGLRAATEHSDYCYDVFADDRYVRVGGIRSTGVSAALALAELVVHDLADADPHLSAHERDDFTLASLPNLAEAGRRPFDDAEAIADDPEFGRLVCFCERVSAAEIRDAFRQPIPARDADGLRRRTRTLMGRCQGFFCAAHVQRLIATDGPGPVPGD